MVERRRSDMIPEGIIRYLEKGGVHYGLRPHPRAVTADELAEATHTRGHHVAKTVLVSADGETWMAVLPADESLRPDRLARSLGAERVSLMSESRFAELFADCEPGAEPPFGGLYGLPTVVDRELTNERTIVLRAGAHDEALEMSFSDYVALEHPRIADFGEARFPDWSDPPTYP
jgi:Ala-tRNA(Pro) deacylase